jgi:hypothetical protein
MNDREVADKMEVIGREEGRSDYPAIRTVNKYRKEFNSLPESKKREYSFFRWPSSMVENLIPWEASLPLLRLFKRKREPHGI